MLSLILFLMTVTCVGLMQFTKWRRKTVMCDLPGWPTLPFIGNVHKFYGGPGAIFRRLQEMTDAAEKHNSMFKVWFGSQLCLVAFKPEDIKIITNSLVDKPYYYQFGRIWLGDGLVTAPASLWKHNIKNLAATFTGSVVDGYQNIFNQQASKLVEKLKSEVNGPPFNIFEKYLTYITLATICQTALGQTTDIFEEVTFTKYYHAFNRCLELMIHRGFNIFLHPDFIYCLTPSYYELKKCIEVLHKVSNKVLQQRKREFNDNKHTTDTNIDEHRSKFRPFLDILIELSKTDPHLTDQQIRAEVDTVIVGGQETTATSLYFTLLMLGCKPDVQDKLYNEIKDIFGSSGRPVETKDLSRMTYCDAVINESLRLFPPLPAVMRYADADLKLNNYTITKGSACVVNAWGAGRSRRLWGDDALDFKPERWFGRLPEHQAAFLAFSYGRRACIGKKYAKALLKTLLAHCIREYKFTSETGKMDFKFDIALRPTNGHYIQLSLRE